MVSCIFRHRLFITLFALANIVLGFCNSSVASVIDKPSIERKDPLKLISVFYTFDKSFPSQLESDQDVFVILYATAASSDCYVMARPSIDPHQLALTLDSAVKGTPLAERPVMYTQADGFSWADAYIGHARMGSRSAEMQHKVGVILTRLREAGFRPHALLLTIKSAKADHRLGLTGFGNRKWRMFNVTSAANLDFVLRSRLSTRDIDLMLVLMLSVPIAGIVGIPALIWLAKRKRSTPSGRRSLFTNSYFWMILICMMLSLKLSHTNMRSIWRYRMEDLWFGTSQWYLGSVLPAILGLAVFIPLSQVIARVVFREAPGERVKKPRKLGHFLSFALLFFMVFLTDELNHNLPASALINHYRIPICMAFWLFIEYAYGRIVRGCRVISGHRTPDDALLSRLSELAWKTGVKLQRVYLVDAPAKGNQSIHIKMSGNILLIRKQLAEQLTPEELDFLAIHEFVHMSRMHYTQVFFISLICIPTVIIGGYMFVTGALCSWMFNWQIWSILLGLIMLVADSTVLSRRREEQTDVASLDLTRDADSAVQALTKALALSNQSTKDFSKASNNLSETLMTQYRLRQLKKNSQAMSISSQSFETMEEDEALTERAKAIAAHFDVKLNKITIIKPAGSQSLVNAGALKGGKIIVGRTLVDRFTPDELDWVLAHEMAHLKCKHVIKSLLGWLLVVSLMIAGLLQTLFAKTISINGLLCSVTALLLTSGGLAWLSRRRETEADRMALRVTRNLPAAVSALRKLTVGNKIEIPEELEHYLSHPKETQRVQSLKKEAKRLGLTENISDLATQD